MTVPRRYHKGTRTGAVLAGAIFVAVAAAPHASAQARSETAGDGERARRAQELPEEPRRWWLGWSRASRQDRLLPAMWTLHVHHVDDGLSNDSLLGVIYDGLYAATFQTTHGPRAYTIGVEREWISASRGPIGGMLGFRSGLVYGYDGRLGWMAEALPILPFAQPVAYGRVGPLTADLTYTWVVVSLTAGVRF